MQVVIPFSNILDPVISLTEDFIPFIHVVKDLLKLLQLLIVQQKLRSLLGLAMHGCEHAGH
jgi:hypothetical protein